MKTDKISIHLAAMRSRMMPGGWSSAIVDVTFRFASLKRAIDTTPSLELFRHVPVSAIAALETYFRATVIDLVNRGGPYDLRATGLIKEKVMMSDAISWFHGKAMTVGEIIARLASFNSVSDIDLWISNLLDINLKAQLKTAVDPYRQRSGLEVGDSIVPDADILFKNIQKAFDTRHILAHEAAAQFDVTQAQALEHLSAASMLVDGVEAVLWQTANAHLPLTQSEMNTRANIDCVAAEAELASLMDAASEVAKRDGIGTWLDESQRIWTAGCKDWINTAYLNQMGSMWPLVASGAHEKLVRQRSELLREWIDSRN